MQPGPRTRSARLGLEPEHRKKGGFLERPSKRPLRALQPALQNAPRAVPQTCPLAGASTGKKKMIRALQPPPLTLGCGQKRSKRPRTASNGLGAPSNLLRASLQRPSKAPSGSPENPRRCQPHFGHLRGCFFHLPALDSRGAPRAVRAKLEEC